MRVRQITYDDDGRIESGTFVMSVREMAYLAKLLGQQTGNSQEETMRGASRDTDCYSPLVDVFNGHYDNGVDGYIREAS